MNPCLFTFTFQVLESTNSQLWVDAVDLKQVLIMCKVFTSSRFMIDVVDTACEGFMFYGIFSF